MIDFLRQLEWSRPLGLAALVVLVPVLYYAVRSLTRRPWWLRGVSLVVRGSLLGLVILSVCGPRQRYPFHEPFVVVAIDQSQSISEPARRRTDAFLDEMSKTASPGRLVYLPFAGRPGLPSCERPATGTASQRQQTDLAAAIRLARRMLPAGFVPRIVLLSDGRSNRSNTLAAAGESNGVPISTVPLPAPEHEVLVTAVRLPDRVRHGERFEAEVLVESAGNDEGTVCLDCGSGPVEQQRVKVATGENRVRFTLSAPQEGWLLYTARLEGFRDEWNENNRLAAPLFVAPGPRAILAEGQAGLASRVAAALRGAGIAVEVCPPDQLPNRPEDLSRYDLVGLFNVPAGRISAPWMDSVGKYVRDGGGGLLVVAGNRSFTPGAYQNTPLENVLPVSSFTRDDKGKPTLAIAIVLDKSLSMADERRIDLAKEATRRAVELLSPRDQVGVLAFEDASYWVSSIRPAAEKASILAAIARIEADKGTNMYPAMERAYLALRQAFADRKHMIVLTDGLSQGADFEGLSHRIADDGITVSTLGLGREVPGKVLADIARVGRGTYYACVNAAELPRIFALETMDASQKGITEKPFVPRSKQASPVFDGIDVDHLPPLVGYAETQAKPNSQTLLVSETGDPILALGPQGRGHSAVFASSTDHRWAAAWQEWPQFDRFWVQVVRLVMRQDDPRWHSSPEDRLARTPPTYGDEVRIGPTDIKLLQGIAESTGGQYDPRSCDVFTPNDRSVPRVHPLWPLLLMLAIPLFFVDVALRRLSRPVGVASGSSGRPVTNSKKS